MPRFLVSIPARVSLSLNAASETDITEALVLENLDKFVELDVETDVFTDQFEILDSDDD